MEESSIQSLNIKHLSDIKDVEKEFVINYEGTFEDTHQELNYKNSVLNCDNDYNYIQLSENYNNQKVIPTLEEGIDLMSKGIELVFENQFLEAIQLGEELSNVSLSHNHLEMAVKGILALFSLENDQIKIAIGICERDIKFSRRLRKNNSFFGSVSRLLWSKIDYYNEYTDEEVYVELCHAEASLMMALLTFFGDITFINMIKGVIQLNSSIILYRKCREIYDNRTKWKSEKLRNEFDSGLKLGVGTFHLIASHLPSMLLKAINIFGYKPNRMFGAKFLTESAYNSVTSRSVISRLVIGAYYGYAEQILGLGKGDLTDYEILLNRGLEKYPNSAGNLWLKGHHHALKGQMNNAIETLHYSISKQNQIIQLHNICYWDIIWCHALKCEWDSAANYAALLRKQCEWSPATFCYMQASFLYMKMIEEDKPEMKQNISDLFKLVPELKKRYAGKTIPQEKFVCVFSETYFQQNEKLFLPAFHLFYIWNIFAYAEDNQSLINPMLSHIESMFTALNEDNKISKNNYYNDNYYHLLFLKGVCYMCLRQYTSAAEYFREILENEMKITRDTFIPPHAALELGRTYIGLKQFDNAKYWLKKAENDYTGYFMKLITHFRIHSAFLMLPQE